VRNTEPPARLLPAFRLFADVIVPTANGYADGRFALRQNFIAA